MIIRSLTGVYEDGTPYGENVPRNARKTLHLVKGMDHLVRVEIIRQNGAPFEFNQYVDLVVLTAKQNPAPFGFPIFSKNGVQSQLAQNVLEFSIVPSDLASIFFTKALFDVVLMEGATNKKTPVIPTSPLFLEGVVHDSVATALKRYWGTGAAAQSSEAFIEALANSDTSFVRQASLSFTPSGSQKLYYAYPTSYGQASFSIAFNAPATVAVTEGLTTRNYYLYESTASFAIDTAVLVA
jgi:hypothetical protein